MWKFLMIVAALVVLAGFQHAPPAKPAHKVHKHAKHAVHKHKKATSKPKPKPKPQPVAVQPHWVTIGTWSGSGNKRTEEFSVYGPWRVSYSFTQDDSTPGDLFQVGIEQPGGDIEDYVANTANKESGQDDSSEYKTGTFDLNITAIAVTWTVTVEAYEP